MSPGRPAPRTAACRLPSRRFMRELCNPAAFFKTQPVNLIYRSTLSVCRGRAKLVCCQFNCPEEQSMVAGENREPMVHLLRVSLVSPVIEQLGPITQRQPFACRMNLER